MSVVLSQVCCVFSRRWSRTVAVSMYVGLDHVLKLINAPLDTIITITLAGLYVLCYVSTVADDY